MSTSKARPTLAGFHCQPLELINCNHYIAKIKGITLALELSSLQIQQKKKNPPLTLQQKYVEFLKTARTSYQEIAHY